jgi:hypothetical protein
MYMVPEANAGCRGTTQTSSMSTLCTGIAIVACFAPRPHLDGLAGPRHVHGVGQVRPAQLRVGHLLLQHLVRAVPHHARDVVVLSRTGAERYQQAASPIATIEVLLQLCERVAPRHPARRTIHHGDTKQQALACAM